MRACVWTAPLHQRFSGLKVFFKGALCRFGEEIQTQNVYIYNINEVIIQTQ